MTNTERKPLYPATQVDQGDVVIVGAGLAGLFTALKLAPMPVTVISAGPLGDGASSVWAQGGIAAAIGEGDTPEDHAADTIVAGVGLCDEAIVRLLTREARGRIEDLLRYGVPFDRDIEGKLMLSREAAHGARRIARVKGDTAGRAIMTALVHAARATPSIRVLEGWSAREIAMSDSRAVGVRIWPANDAAERPGLLIRARAVVLATGGAGQLFAVTTNPPQARGEGLAMAARAGAVLSDVEFVQFHPTAIAIGRDPAPLATEALRGEGAILVNGLDKRFLAERHPLAELAPRDVVAEAVHREVIAGRGAYLDCRAAIGAHMPKIFPTVHAACMSAGIDPTTDLIPVAPAAHYHMGGILTDANGRTTIDRLWACGEVASTGAHGANRLASNSLLEAVVFGARIADDIAGQMPFRDARRSVDSAIAMTPRTGDDPARARLRQIMSTELGVIREREGIVRALSAFLELERSARHDLEFANMLTSAKLIAAAALKREETRGAHRRSDFPRALKSFQHRTRITLEEADAIAHEAAGSGGEVVHVVFGT